MSDPASNASARRTCGTTEVHERLIRSVPGYLEARRESENRAWEYDRARTRGEVVGRLGITSIPAVVHVVYHDANQNISDEQVFSQFSTLNEDYRMLNNDCQSIPAAFKYLVADSLIQFTLAAADPAGNPTNGITRTYTDTLSFGTNDDVKWTATGGVDGWPSESYLNIWVCALDGLLGYAQFPGGPSSTDGVVILHSAFGTMGTATSPFHLGRTTTHEIGHWLNLRHIWGDDDGGCNGDDFVVDTPNCGRPNYGSPTFPSVSCDNGPDGDLFMNYMDYVDDGSMYMFTPGQVARMQAALDGDRNSIGTNSPM